MHNYKADSYNQRHHPAATCIKYFMNLVSFLLKLMTFLLSPAPRVRPPPPTLNLCAVPLPRSPEAQQRAQETGLQLLAVAPTDKGLHLKGGVGWRGCYGKHASSKQRRKGTQVPSLLSSPKSTLALEKMLYQLLGLLIYTHENKVLKA